MVASELEIRIVDNVVFILLLMEEVFECLFMSIEELYLWYGTQRKEGSWEGLGSILDSRGQSWKKEKVG